MVSPSRRTVLTGLGLYVAGLVGRPADASAALAELALFGPPAGPSITITHAISAGLFSHVADKATFKVWQNPDEMRAGLTSGTMKFVVMPTTTAANLYNRGLGVRLVNVMTNGLLYVVALDPQLTSIPSLAGKSIVLPFRNDTPEFVLKRLLREHGVDPAKDITISTTGTPIEAMLLLLIGRADAALVPEPLASAAIQRAAMVGKTVHRVMSIQEEWGRVSGGSAALPQAGLAVTSELLRANPATVDAIHGVLAKASEQVVAEPVRAASNAASALGFPAAVIEKSIPYSNLVAIRSAAARVQLETMFETIAEYDRSMIGGRLPDSGFYV